MTDVEDVGVPESDGDDVGVAESEGVVDGVAESEGVVDGVGDMDLEGVTLAVGVTLVEEDGGASSRPSVRSAPHATADCSVTESSQPLASTLASSSAPSTGPH